MSITSAANAVALGARLHQQTYRPQPQNVYRGGASGGGGGGGGVGEPLGPAGTPTPVPGGPATGGIDVVQMQQEIVDRERQARFFSGNATNAELEELVQRGEMSRDAAFDYATQRDQVGSGANLQRVSVGGTMYNFDPKTGQYTLALDAEGNPLTGTGGGGGSGGGYVDTGPTQQQQIQNAMAFQQLLNQQKQNDLNNQLNAIQELRAQQTLALTQRNNALTQLQNAGPNLVGDFQYFGGWNPGGPGPALAALNGLNMAPVPTAGHVVNLPIDPNAGAVDPAVAALLARIGGGNG